MFKNWWYCVPDICFKFVICVWIVLINFVFQASPQMEK
jgi:hypothetical protein